ncbi:MAG: signal peptidase I [Lachnospiraceae bacterium]
MAGLSFRKRKRRIPYHALKEGVFWVAEAALAFAFACILVVNFGMMISNVGQSMEPLLGSGDKVLANKLIYGLREPQRGDLVVFKPNGNENSHYYIKRVIALPGETVQIIDGFVYIDGEVFIEDIKTEQMEYAGVAEEALTLEKDEYFVLGDNRNASEDSRNAEIGNVKEEDITARAWFVISPWSNFGFIR